MIERVTEHAHNIGRFVRMAPNLIIVNDPIAIKGKQTQYGRLTNES